MRPLDRIALGIALAAAPLRILIAAATSLTPDEAYYASAAALGTTVPDHPPLVVWGAHLGQLLPTVLPLELRLRTLSLVLGTLVSLVVVDRVRRESESADAQRWAALLGSWLLLPLAGGFLATPDVAVFLATLVIVESENREDLPWHLAPLVFAAVFLGMAAKVIIAPVALAVVVTTRHGWRQRLVLLAALAASLPLVSESLQFQLNHAFGAAGGSAAHIGIIPAVGAAFLGQAALWTPIVLLLVLRAWRRLPRAHLAVASSLTGLFLLSAVVRGVAPEPNWLAPAFAALLPLAAQELASASTAMRVAFAVLGPVATLVAASHVLRPWLPVPEQKDPTARLRGAVTGAGAGPYGPAARDCATGHHCEKISTYIQEVRNHLESVP